MTKVFWGELTYHYFHDKLCQVLRALISFIPRFLLSYNFFSHTHHLFPQFLDLLQTIQCEMAQETKIVWKIEQQSQ